MAIHGVCRHAINRAGIVHWRDKKTRPRYEVILPHQPLQRLWHWLQWATQRSSSQIAAWHPIPHDLATKANRVRIFEDAWQRHVSPGEAIYLQRPEAVEQFRKARALPPKVKQRQKTIWR